VKLSIIIAVLDSHEIVRRQIEYFKQMALPEDVEIILVDDGSEPPLYYGGGLKNFTMIATNDKRRWTQGLARMKGIEQAKGEYIFCTDIDHIISREAIEEGREFAGDKMVFQRRFAYLDPDGKLIRDRQKLLVWGLREAAIRDEFLSDGVHGNTWMIKKQIFNDLGGYDLTRCNSGTHLQGEDREFNRKWYRANKAGRYMPQVQGPPIYFFPMGKYHATGDENPHGLFHLMVKEKWGDN
jgi:hypothetical protein